MHVSATQVIHVSATCDTRVSEVCEESMTELREAGASYASVSDVNETEVKYCNYDIVRFDR